MPRKKITAMLEGSDQRSIGRANEVARLVLKESRRFRELIKCLWDENPVVRKTELLGLLAEAEQIELRWHLAAMIPRLRLTAPQRHRAAAVLQRYLEDRSSVVKTFAMQGLADLSQNDADLRSKVKHLLEEAVQSGTPAMRARARNLLKKYPA
jgi:hypothetical protein